MKKPVHKNLTFDDNNTQSLQSSGQVSLEGDFTIGARVKVTTSGGVLLGDNTTSGEFIRFSTNTQFRVRIDNTTAINIDKLNSLDHAAFLHIEYVRFYYNIFLKK